MYDGNPGVNLLSPDTPPPSPPPSNLPSGGERGVPKFPPRGQTGQAAAAGHTGSARLGHQRWALYTVVYYTLPPLTPPLTPVTEEKPFFLSLEWG